MCTALQFCLLLSSSSKFLSRVFLTRNRLATKKCNAQAPKFRTLDPAPKFRTLDRNLDPAVTIVKIVHNVLEIAKNENNILWKI